MVMRLEKLQFFYKKLHKFLKICVSNKIIKTELNNISKITKYYYIYFYYYINDDL